MAGRPYMRRLLLALLIVLALLLAGSAAVTWLVTTQPGLSAAIRVAQHYIDLDIDSAEGQLTGPLRLRGVRLRSDAFGLRVEEMELDWSPRALLDGTLRIDRLHADGLLFQLAVGVTPAAGESATLTLPRLPFGVEIIDLEVARIAIVRQGTTPLMIDRLVLAARADAGGVRIDRLEIASPEIALQASGGLAATGDEPLAIDLRWHARLPGLPPLRGAGHIRGTLDDLRIAQTLDQGVLGELSVRIRDAADAPVWAMTLDLHGLGPHPALAAVAALHPSGQIEAAGNLEHLRASVTLEVELAELGPAALQMEVAGGRESLDIEQLTLELTAGGALEARGHFDPATARVSLNGRWRELAWPLDGKPAITSSAGRFNLTASPDGYRAVLDGRLDSPATGPLVMHVEGHGDAMAINLDALQLRAVDHPEARVVASGRYRLDDDAVQLEVNWQALPWPLQGETTLRSEHGSLSLAGPVDAYMLVFEAELTGPALPDARWHLQGTGDPYGLEIEALRGELLDGRVEAHGRIAWHPAPAWEITLAGEALDPSVQWRDWPGRIAFDLTSQGRIETDRIEAWVELVRLQGQVVDRSLRGHGRATLDGAQIRVEELELAVDGGEASLSGQFDEEIEANFRLRLPDLATLLPDAAGLLTAAGTISGPWQRPRIALRLDGESLRYAKSTLGALHVDAEVDLATDAASTLVLSAERVQAAGRRWSRLTLDGSGTLESHRIVARADGDVMLGLRLDGGWDGTRWQAILAGVTVDAAGIGAWLQAEPASLTVAPELARLTALCLDSGSARLCVDGDWQRAAGAALRGHLTDWPAGRLAAWLPTNLGFDGRLGADLELRLPAGSHPEGRVEATLRDGILRLGDTTEPVEIDIRALSLRGAVDGERGWLNAELDLGDHGTAQAALQFAELAARPRVTGTITADYHERGLLAALVPALRKVQADLHADLALDGPLAAPLVTGELRLDRASAELPAAGIHLQSDGITLRGSGRGPLHLAGTLRSGEGRLVLAGELTPAPLTFHLTARGEAFTAMETGEIRAVVSPDLEFAFADRLLSIRGSVDLPLLLLEPRGLTASVTRSADVIIVDAPKPAEPPLRVDARLRVTLGDEVHIRIPGLEARLEGALEVSQEPGRSATATGTVALVSGSYEVFGQRLEIARGRVLYAGGPVSDPGLDLEAVRQVGEVTAGVRIGGRLAAPEVHLFSVPAQPDSVVLSYLLFGRPPDARSSEEGALLTQAGLALGMQGGNLLAGSLQQALGLDVLEFERGATVEESALVVGKYLSPTLYISYGLGLFEPVSRFLVRYQLTPHLSVESSSSDTASGTDLIYTIER